MGKIIRFQVLQASTLERVSLVLFKGEIVFDTDLNFCFVGDGVTLGGLPFSGVDPLVTQIFTDDAPVSGIDYAIANKATPITFTLPDATTYQKKINVKNSGIGELTLLPVATQLIDGLTDVQLQSTNSVELVPKAGAWYIW